MTQKDFFRLVDDGTWYRYTSVQLLQGVPCIETYLHNFEFFMNEIKRSRRKGYRHIPFTYSFDGIMEYRMKAWYFFTQGSIKIIFPEGTIIYSQVNNEAIMTILRSDEK